MSITTISETALERALSLRDLTDPPAGEHAVQHVVAAIEQAVAAAWRIPVRREPGSRLVEVTDNYDRLRYRPDAVTRDARYTRYVGPTRMLRSHTTAAIPGLLDRLAASGTDEVVLPGSPWRTPPSLRPYTVAGREIYVHEGGRDVEVRECGLAHPEVLVASGLPAGASGLAMGLGLDRLTMLVKGVPDIRLLRAADPRRLDGAGGVGARRDSVRPVAGVGPPPCRRAARPQERTAAGGALGAGPHAHLGRGERAARPDLRRAA